MTFRYVHIFKKKTKLKYINIKYCSNNFPKLLNDKSLEVGL